METSEVIAGEVAVSSVSTISVLRPKSVQVAPLAEGRHECVLSVADVGGAVREARGVGSDVASSILCAAEHLFAEMGKPCELEAGPVRAQDGIQHCLAARVRCQRGGYAFMVGGKDKDPNLAWANLLFAAFNSWQRGVRPTRRF